MSWQDRERERYEGMLAERWTREGKKIPAVTRKTQAMYNLWRAQVQQAQSPRLCDAGFYDNWTKWGAVKEQD